MGAPTAVGRPPRDLIPGQLDDRTRDGSRAGTRRRHIVTLVLLSIRIKPRAGRYLPGKMPYDQAVDTSPAAPGRVSRACCSPVAAIALRRAGGSLAAPAAAELSLHSGSGGASEASPDRQQILFRVPPHFQLQLLSHRLLQRRRGTATLFARTPPKDPRTLYNGLLHDLPQQPFHAPSRQLLDGRLRPHLALLRYSPIGSWRLSRGPAGSLSGRLSPPQTKT